MNTLTALWLLDVLLASLVIYGTVRYLNLVAPKGRRMEYKYANSLVAILTKLGEMFIPVALLCVGVLANVMVFTGNVLACLTVITCGMVAIRATNKAYRALVG